MRRILVDDARKRNSAKRGGMIQVPLDEASATVAAQAANVAALDDALQRLEEIDKRQGQIVELRFFGG